MGERVSIDDFGTGYSSLAYLQRLPVDELKIDRSFVTSLSAASADAVIVRSTVELAHNLGLTVVAEGVEDEAAVSLLHEYGCDRVQGYLFSRPCPAEELTAWLTESCYGLAVGNGAG
jgi:EAL domain-containing protein (putative c-di-GMP-specific phosphodiesterase class I)